MIKILMFMFALMCVQLVQSAQIHNTGGGYIVVTCRPERNIAKFSTEEAISVLELIDRLRTNYDQQVDSEFTKLTACSYKDIDLESVQKSLHTVIKENSINQSVYMKVMGIITFYNIVLVCLSGVGIALLFSLASDVLIIFGKWILSRQFLYTCGYTISLFFTLFQKDTVSTSFKPLFFFDNQSALFGTVLFVIVANASVFDIMDAFVTKKKWGKDEKRAFFGLSQIFILCFTFWSTIYHSNWLIGVVAITLVFHFTGFTVGAFFGGYYVDFKNDYVVERCIATSILLNCVFLSLKLTHYTDFYYLELFETGIMFWGTFVGLCGLLVVRYKNYSMASIVMAVTCLLLMYVGNVQYINSYKNLGGTFMVLLALDLQRAILSMNFATLALLVIFANLYALKELLSRYPEYFIF
ncbi:MAG: hypothetical protein Terrestrivirus5_90 [Terrestrivirus sp.]|uniref:Uncharacterized protein n=1 Tax=Terrestrivirus sp. TaxID=2487775 RepID=A0A3G4ZN41_9VIRU|nr:MAG: hypothetical protein Terrestrivirus5_90 [Terrestrivirus sp.]